jgi:hypothetical protein
MRFCAYTSILYSTGNDSSLLCGRKDGGIHELMNYNFFRERFLIPDKAQNI